jgi:hypothetical protein
MSSSSIGPDELSEEAVKDQFVRVMNYVTEWADTEARRDDVMSTLWTVMNRRPKFAATIDQQRKPADD